MYQKIFIFISLYSYLIINPLYSQSSVDNTQLLIRSKIIDLVTGKELKYAHIINLKTKKGTISDENGNFEINVQSLQDTLEIKFLGYSTYKESAGNIIKMKIIKLEPHSFMLGAIDLTSNNDGLYRMLVKLKKGNRYTEITAKTYYTLESKKNNERVEYIECYYNGIINGYNLTNLDLKNGRLALKRKNNHFFVSTGLSSALSKHHLLSKNEYFPTSPFELNKNRLEKYYSLNLNYKYESKEGSIIHVVNFKPKEPNGRYFSGTVWVDSLNNRIYKVNLNCKDPVPHPFLPLWYGDSLLHLEFDINKTFTELDGNMYVNQIDFKYSLLFRMEEGAEMNVESRAIIYAYNFYQEFEIPIFKHSQSSHIDYRKISAVPYNEFFWENLNEFEVSQEGIKMEKFLQDPEVFEGADFFTKTLFGVGFFEQPYQSWKTTRIFFKKDENQVTTDNYKNIPLINRFNLGIQIYLDYNVVDGEVNLLTSTIFDPFQTYYFGEIGLETQCFINIYFDLVEIKRRQMVAEIEKKNLNFDEIKILHIKTMREIDRLKERYVAETRAGNNLSMMRKWNEVVKEQLQIDNIAFFLSETSID